MATVKNGMPQFNNGTPTGKNIPRGKTVNDTYRHDQTVEEAQPATGADVQMGNTTGIRARSIYRQWNAAYRGFVPHGVRLPSPTKGNLQQFEDDPETFVEEVQEPSFEPPVNVEEVDDYEQDYWGVSTFNVTTVPMLLAGIQPERTLIRMINQGPGIVWIAHNESIGSQGFPLVPMGTIFYDLELHTTREIWATQQTAQASPAQLTVLREFTKEFHQ